MNEVVTTGSDMMSYVNTWVQVFAPIILIVGVIPVVIGIARFIITATIDKTTPPDSSIRQLTKPAIVDLDRLNAMLESLTDEQRAKLSKLKKHGDKTEYPDVSDLFYSDGELKEDFKS